MTRMLAILALAALAVGCGTSPRAVERKGRIISLTDSILTTGGTDTVRFGRLGSGEIAAPLAGQRREPSRGRRLLPAQLRMHDARI